MKIPLNEFEQHIDEDILKRGLQYFKKGYVSSVDELSTGEYEATVEGSETYTVHMEIKNGLINDHYCTCPYDRGSVCKHEVAVMFYLQQEELGIEAKPKKASSAGVSLRVKPPLKKPLEKKKKKTVQEQLSEILDLLSADELKGYIGECCDKDKAFRDMFLARYLHLIQPVSQDMYAKQIRSIVSLAAGRYGYLDYSAARKVGKAVYEFSQLADKTMNAGNYREAMYMGCAILEEMTKAITHGDDSSGDLGGSIEAGQDILFRVAEDCVDKAVRRELMDYALNAYQKQLFNGWDWYFHMLDLAIELIETEKDKMIIGELIDRIKPTGDKWDYEYDRARLMKLELIRKTEGAAEVNRYLETNVDNDNFRRQLILEAIKEKNYSKVISLSEAGIVADQKDKPGLVDEWKGYLLTVYQLQGDTVNVILQARDLFLSSGRFSTQEIFQILKEYVATNEWKDFFEQLVVDRTKSEKWVRFHSIADMYIWEEQWEKLLSLLIANKSLDNISYVEKYLASHYAEQLAGMYNNAIEDYLKQSVGREYYKTACKYIRRMIKLGGRDEADYLIADLRKQYPQRRALLEELDKV